VTHGNPEIAKAPPDLEAALEKAMSVDNVDEAKKLVQKVMKKAVEENKVRRKEMKDVVVEARNNKNSSQRGVPTIFGWKRKRTEPEKIAVTSCVFDSLSAGTALASMAANINDASKTCESVDMKDMFTGDTVHERVCSLNVAAAVGGITGLASTLSLAADDCAATLVPNVDALCSGSITGLVTAVAQIGGAGSLVAAACHPKGWYARIPPELKPSNVGSNKILHREEAGQSVEQVLDSEVPVDAAAAAPVDAAVPPVDSGAFADDAAQPAGQDFVPVRRLLFGGGKDSMRTHCGLQIANMGWAIASTVMSINAAANENSGASCPPTNIFGGTAWHGPVYKVNQAFCTLDITSAITAFAQIIAYIQLLVVSCTDELNLEAICGSGVDGMIAALSGIAQASTGIHLACDKFGGPLVKKALKAATAVDKISGGAVSAVIGNFQAGTDFEVLSFGRRLEGFKDAMHARIAAMKKRFKSVEEAWGHMGVNLTDPHAEWRNRTSRAASTSSVIGMNEQPEVSRNLFTPPTCS